MIGCYKATALDETAIPSAEQTTINGGSLIQNENIPRAKIDKIQIYHKKELIVPTG